MLFNRDYRQLTPEERELWEKVEEKLKNPNGSRIQTERMRKEYRAAMPLAALHYKELFPNNWLDARRLTDEKNNILLKEFKALITSKPNERQVLNFIKEKQAYFIVGSILGTHFRFGHHELFLFNEFELPPNHIVDYVLIGRNSARNNYPTGLRRPDT